MDIRGFFKKPPKDTASPMLVDAAAHTKRPLPLVDAMNKYAKVAAPLPLATPLARTDAAPTFEPTPRTANLAPAASSESPTSLLELLMREERAVLELYILNSLSQSSDGALELQRGLVRARQDVAAATEVAAAAPAATPASPAGTATSPAAPPLRFEPPGPAAGSSTPTQVGTPAADAQVASLSVLSSDDGAEIAQPSKDPPPSITDRAVGSKAACRSAAGSRAMGGGTEKQPKAVGGKLVGRKSLPRVQQLTQALCAVIDLKQASRSARSLRPLAPRASQPCGPIPRALLAPHHLSRPTLTPALTPTLAPALAPALTLATLAASRKRRPVPAARRSRPISAACDSCSRRGPTRRVRTRRRGRRTRLQSSWRRCT